MPDLTVCEHTSSWLLSLLPTLDHPFTIPSKKIGISLALVGLDWLMALNEPNPDSQNSRNRNKKSRLILAPFSFASEEVANQSIPAGFRLAFSRSSSLPNPDMNP